jgi:hypothetical protein
MAFLDTSCEITLDPMFEQALPLGIVFDALEMLLVLNDNFDQVLRVQGRLGCAGDGEPFGSNKDEQPCECLLKDDVVRVNRHHFRETEGFVLSIESHGINLLVWT